VFLVAAALLSYAEFGVASGQDAVKDAPSPADTATKKAEPTATEKAAKKVNTVVAEVAPLRLTAELDGFVDSPAKYEITLRPKSLKELKLIGSQGHSQRVSRGQLVLQLEAEAWERARRTAEQGIATAEQDLKQANYGLDSLEESSRIELEAAELANDAAQEGLEYFLNEGRKNTVEDLEYSLESSKQNVDYVREEYEQLKKMYDADDLTEESEEIVLKRALNDLKRAERNLMLTERRIKRTLEVDLDRQEAGLKNTAAKAKIDLEKLQRGQEAKKVLAKVAVAKAEAAVEVAKKELANLNEDRQLLGVASPINGILFWGAANQSWKGASSVEDAIVIGNNLPTNRTLMTIVSNEKLFIRTNVPERLINSIKPGDSAYFEATSQPGSRIELVCEEKADVPLEPGNYRTAFRFVRASDSEGLLPLMTGKITAMLYEKEKALLVPVEAIRYDGSKSYVMVQDEASGLSSRQDVSLGKRDGKRVEISQGLREGEHVVLP
jgi:multidrug resistance efflux pump